MDISDRLTDSYLTFVVVGLVIGAVLVPVATSPGPVDEEGTGTVAVVPVEGGIDGVTASQVTAMLQQARSDPDIEAVVIVANSGGGTASASEEMYLQVKRTTEDVPVVAAVDAAAASGAYYTIAPSDYIYAKPSSIVGSVGVLAPLPPTVEPQDIVAATGPNKLAGAESREFFYMLDRLQSAFVEAVFAQRGDRLALTRTELSQARIYVGSQAVNNGLVDELGGRQAAVEKAAALAGLERYRVKVLRPGDATARFLSRSNYLASDAPNKTMVEPRYFIGNSTETPLFLMLPATYVDGGSYRVESAASIQERLAEGNATTTATPEAPNATATATNATTPRETTTPAGGDQ